MIAISEIKLYDILKTKFNINETDAREMVAEVVSVNEKTDKILNEKIDERFKDSKDIFLTKNDKNDLLKEIYTVRTDLEKSLRTHFYWTVGLSLFIIGTLITSVITILSRLPSHP